jgi:hypothetical protein
MAKSGPAPDNGKKPNKLYISLYSVLLFFGVLVLTQYVPLMSGLIKNVGMPLLLVQCLVFFGVVLLSMQPWKN